MSYTANGVLNLKTIKALRGEIFSLDLGQTLAGTLTAWMKKSPDATSFRPFTIENNRFLTLSAVETSDYYDTENVLIESIVGKWYFDVEQVLDPLKPFEAKTIYRGTILFQGDITNSCGVVVNNGVMTVEGDLVDNTDPKNPIILTPDLQQVTEEGNQTTNSLIVYNTINQTSSQIHTSSLGTFNDLDNSSLSFFDSKNIQGQINGRKNTILLTNRTIAGEAIFSFKDNKPIGSYIIATLDDITGGMQDLQQTLDNGSYAEYDGGTSFIDVLSGDTDDREFIVQTGNGTVSYGAVFTNNVSSQLISANGTIKGEFISENGKPRIVNTNIGLGSNIFSFEDIVVDGVNIKVPAKSSPGTYILATTDDISDNGGIIVYNVKDYGALGDGLTDDTVAIQTTINTCFAEGGGVVYFPNGIYIIGGALQNDVGVDLVDYNSQIYVPQENFTATTRRTIEFLGETPPNFLQSAGIGSTIPPNTGAVLRSTIQGSGVRPSVICNRGASSNAAELSFTTTFFKNIGIQITPNVTSKLTMGGINCEFSANANFENVTVFPYNLNLVNSGKPDVIDIVGIAMPKVNDEHINVLNKCSVGGFTQGYLLGEHTSAYDVVAICCLNGFNQTANYHMGNYNKISAFWCQNSFHVSGASNFIVQSLQTEWDSQSKWYDSLYTLSDEFDQGKGILNFNIVVAGGGFDNTKFKKSGGFSVKTNPISIVPIKGTSLTSYTLIQEDLDKDLFITTNSSPVTITIPNYSNVNFDAGKTLKIAQYGDGKVTLIGAGGVLLNTASSLSTKNKFSVIFATKQYNNDWVIYGDLL